MSTAVIPFYRPREYARRALRRNRTTLTVRLSLAATPTRSGRPAGPGTHVAGLRTSPPGSLPHHLPDRTINQEARRPPACPASPPPPLCRASSTHAMT